MTFMKLEFLQQGIDVEFLIDIYNFVRSISFEVDTDIKFRVHCDLGNKNVFHES